MLLVWIANAGVVLFVVGACRHLLRQRRRRREWRGELLVSPRANLVVSSMLMEFQAFYQPQVRHVLVELQKEESEDDENGEGPPGGRLFHRQLRRIRNGEEVEELTVEIRDVGA